MRGERSEPRVLDVMFFTLPRLVGKVFRPFSAEPILLLLEDLANSKRNWSKALASILA